MIVKCKQEKNINYHESELENNIEEKMNDPTEDPLLWWCNHEKKFQTIFKLVWKFLGSPPTSVPSEIIFYAARLLISKLRNTCLRTVYKIIFLNKNSYQLKTPPLYIVVNNYMLHLHMIKLNSLINYLFV